MLDFLKTNWDSVLIVVILVVLYFTKQGSRKKIRRMLFYLVTEAEIQFGSGTGLLKYSAVTTWLYERLPGIIKILFTDKQIDAMIEEEVTKLKDYLENNSKAKLLIE